MKYAITNAVILDGTKDMQPVYGKTILVDGERISAIVPAEDPVPVGCDVVDLGGSYILPGLINLHVHLAGSGKPKNNSSDAKRLVGLVLSNPITRAVGRALVAGYAKTQLMSGTTTIRTVAGLADFDTDIRNKINAGRAIGPRILAGNMAVSVPGGHMAGSLAYEAHTPEEAAHFVDVIAREKPDVIKLMITGGVSDAEKRDEPGILRMPPEIVNAAAKRAHELGYPVAAHVESPEGVKVALENGVDSIEHGAQPTPEIVELFKQKNAFQVLTISPALPFAEFDRDVMHITEIMQENGKIVFDGVISLAKALLEAGVPVGLGTDTGCPYVTQYDMWRELNYYVKYCGVTPAFAIYSATLLNATLAGIGGETGSIEAGKSADMIVVDENPLEKLSALRNVKTVFVRGRKITPKFKKLAEVEAKLDEYI